MQETCASLLHKFLDCVSPPLLLLLILFMQLMMMIVNTQKQRRVVADDGDAADAGLGDVSSVRPPRSSSRRHAFNRVWSRPPRLPSEKPLLRGPYDSPAGSSDEEAADAAAAGNEVDDSGADDVSTQRLDDLDTNLSTDDDAELNSYDDADRFETTVSLSPSHKHVYKLSYSQFCLKFRCRGKKGRSEINLNDPVELAVPENHTIEPKITNLSCIQPTL